MEAVELMDKLENKAREYSSFNGIKVLDKDGNEITEVIFKISEGYIQLK